MGLFIRRISILFLLLAATTSFPQTSLKVLDPEQSWRTYPGSIDEAIFSVGPKGIYFQISAYLTFSAKGSNLTTANPLEVVYNFELPEGSIVTDMWLWIGDKISNGKIMDLWTAAQIYESIVKRKQDPAFLKKTGAKSYQLRVYPMGAKETRKVKITYLTPVTWGLNNVVLNVPTNLLSVSALQIPKLLLKTWKTTDWGAPTFSDRNYTFAIKNDSFFGEHYEADITNLSRIYNNFLTFQSPMVDGVYFKHYKKGEEGYYELALFPGNTLPANTKKILFLIDYDLRKSTTTREQILSSLKLQIRSNLTLNDSFNIMFSGLSIGKASPAWVTGDPANIDKIFTSVSENSISTYSNLPALMSAGIEYINKNGASGKMFLLSNSDLQGNSVTANQLISDLRKLMTVNYPVMIYDY
ncbi:MAG: VIT domain-containing protein, partial [Bacteroidota bacterium]